MERLNMGKGKRLREQRKAEVSPDPPDMSNDPDVQWACAVLNGHPMLALQTKDQLVSASLLVRNYETVELRFMYDNDCLPDLVLNRVLCYANEDYDHPIFSCDPDPEYDLPMLEPLLAALTENRPWILVLQGVLNGGQLTQVHAIAPDSSAQFIREVSPWLIKTVYE